MSKYSCFILSICCALGCQPPGSLGGFGLSHAGPVRYCDTPPVGQYTYTVNGLIAKEGAAALNGVSFVSANGDEVPVSKVSLDGQTLTVAAPEGHGHFARSVGCHFAV